MQKVISKSREVNKPTSQAKFTSVIIAIIASIIVGSGIISSAFADKPTNIDYSVTVEPALNITTSSNKVSLDLNPLNHDFDSQDLTVSVSTNNETGYKLYVNTDSTKLIEKDDSNLYIETLSSEVPESSFTANRWGYKLNSDNYLPFVSGTLINSSKTQIENNASTLTFAAKVGYETKAGSYNLALNFQATANPYIPYIQNLDPNLCTEKPITTIDERDGQEYVVAKLKDDRCWMITNLNLGAKDLQTEQLNKSNTNINDGSSISASDWVTYKKTAGTGTYVAAEYIYVSGNDAMNDMPFNTLYNYCAASAKTICVDSNSSNATSDICPAGWRLPTGSTNGELQALYDSGYEANVKMRAPIGEGGAAATLAGVVSTTGGAAHLQDEYGMLVSSTVYHNSTKDVYGLFLNNVVTNDPNNKAYRNAGFSVRCILK